MRKIALYKADPQTGESERVSIITLDGPSWSMSGGEMLRLWIEEAIARGDDEESRDLALAEEFHGSYLWVAPLQGD